MKVQLTQFALRKLDLVVDEFWAEISDSIQTIEVRSLHQSFWVEWNQNALQVVSEDDIYPAEVRQQAALVASKVLLLIIVESCCHQLYYSVVLSHHLYSVLQVYYHLGSYEDSLQYALGADTLFDISDTRSQ